MIILKTKKIPLRKCIGCGENKPKKDLIRVVRNSQKEVVLDTTGRINGRGAYICRDVNCFEKIDKSRKLSKVLDTDVPDKIYKDLESIIKLNLESE